MRLQKQIHSDGSVTDADSASNEARDAERPDPVQHSSLPASSPPASSAQATSAQTLRAERTRAALLVAAEKIFARDGFEASRIEDIAAEAGRTRGAFYANFESKTEVFLALRSLATQRRFRALHDRLAQISGESARYEAVVCYILQQICDHNSLLLQIEFKLFAVRHPEMREQLSEKHLETSTPIFQNQMAEIFVRPDETAEQARQTTLAIEAILEGVALNSLFSPRVLDQRWVEEFVPVLLQKIFRRA